MWRRKDDLSFELKDSKSLDWVNIDGRIWVEIQDEKECPNYVKQSVIEGRSRENVSSAETPALLRQPAREVKKC